MFCVLLSSKRSTLIYKKQVRTTLILLGKDVKILPLHQLLRHFETLCAVEIIVCIIIFYYLSCYNTVLKICVSITPIILIYVQLFTFAQVNHFKICFRAPILERHVKQIFMIYSTVIWRNAHLVLNVNTGKWLLDFLRVIWRKA